MCAVPNTIIIIIIIIIIYSLGALARNRHKILFASSYLPVRPSTRMSAKLTDLKLLLNFTLGAATEPCRHWTSSEGFQFLFLNSPVPLTVSNTAKLLFFLLDADD